MTKEIERAAQALTDLYRDSVLGGYGNDDLARAAIASLLPPSDAMVEAGIESMRRFAIERLGFEDGPMRPEFRPEYEAVVRVILTAAINAALGAKP